MLPAMRDMHIHLDKTFYGGPRRSLNRPAGTTIQDMIRPNKSCCLNSSLIRRSAQKS